MTIKNNNILDESTNRTKGVDALNSNIEAAKAVANIVKTTLGPMGMDKMLIDSVGETVITNDGVKILKEMDIDHPGAKMLVEVAKTQEAQVGDGTTSSVILSGELLSKAQELIRQKIHPTVIIRGYKKASIKALEVLKTNSLKVDVNDEKMLRSVCETAMTGKVADSAKGRLSKLIYEATSLVKDGSHVPKDLIKIQKVATGSTQDSSLVKGVVLDKNLANSNMPNRKDDAKVLLMNIPLEVRELDSDAQLQITTPEDYEKFMNQEHTFLKELAMRIKDVGADFVVCQKGIDDSVAYYLAKAGIMAVSRARKSDMDKLTRALGVSVLTSFDDIVKENLGFAGMVSQKSILDENYIFVEGLKNPKAITLLLKSATPHILDEIERACEDAIGDIDSILRFNRIVAGGGAIEVELFKNLLTYSKTFAGKEQLVVEAFANCFLSIPKVLLENCGYDEIEYLTKLISMHEKGDSQAGLDGFVGVVTSTLDCGIVEPIAVKEQAIKSSTEICSMILRIDDIIAAKSLSSDLDNGRGSGSGIGGGF